MGGAPDVGVGRVRLLDRIAVREVACLEELAHALAAAEFVDERRVEPRLVDPQVRVHEQAVAVEALDVVALVGRSVAPHVDAVVLHRPHEQRAGHRPTERRGVEVRLAGRRDVERSALQGDQALADEFVTAVDEAGLFGAVDLGPIGNGVEFGLVVLSEIGGVGVRDRSPVAHPRHGGGGVEPAGEGDAHAFPDGKRHEDLGIGGGTAGRRVGHGRRRYRPSSGGAARYTPENEPSDTSATAPAIANSIAARPPDRDRSGIAIRASTTEPPKLDPRQPPDVVAGEDDEHGDDGERDESDVHRFRIRSGSEPPGRDPDLLTRLPHGEVREERPDPGDDHGDPPGGSQLAGSRCAFRCDRGVIGCGSADRGRERRLPRQGPARASSAARIPRAVPLPTRR